ncbi:MAG: phytoene desaturase family protein [Candidatus Helarchaeota archaeon]
MIEDNSIDVIIIGGGAAGTASAALLAKWGYKVLLVEQKSNLGGRASTLTLHNGFKIDTGVHGIPYYDLGSLKEIESELEITFDLVDYQPLLTFYDADEEISVEVADFTDKGFKEVDRIWGYNGQFLKLLGQLRQAKNKNLDELDKISVKDHFSQFVHNLQFHQLLEAINGMITITPELGSAGEFVRSFSKLFSSNRPITYPRNGGIQSISELLGNFCKKREGEILLSTKVTEIVIQKGRAVGVKTMSTDENGNTIHNEFQASALIVTTPLQFLFQLVSKEFFSEGFIEKIKTLKDKQSCAQGIGVAFKEELLQDFPWNPKCWGAIIFQPDKRPRYLSVPSALVEGLAPPGEHYMFYGVVSTPKELKDKRATKTRLKELIEELNHLFPRLKKFKGWHFSGSSEMVLGTAKRVGLTGKFKPANICPDVEGLFFAGDTAEGEGPGLECTYNSALRCAKKVKKFLEVKNQVLNEN